MSVHARVWPLYVNGFLCAHEKFLSRDRPATPADGAGEFLSPHTTPAVAFGLCHHHRRPCHSKREASVTVYCKQGKVSMLIDYLSISASVFVNQEEKSRSRGLISFTAPDLTAAGDGRFLGGRCASSSLHFSTVLYCTPTKQVFH